MPGSPGRREQTANRRVAGYGEIAERQRTQQLIASMSRAAMIGCGGLRSARTCRHCTKVPAARVKKARDRSSSDQAMPAHLVEERARADAEHARGARPVSARR